jgi:hypothetical protein
MSAPRSARSLVDDWVEGRVSTEEALGAARAGALLDDPILAALANADEAEGMAESEARRMLESIQRAHTSRYRYGWWAAAALASAASCSVALCPPPGQLVPAARGAGRTVELKRMSYEQTVGGTTCRLDLRIVQHVPEGSHDLP